MTQGISLPDFVWDALDARKRVWLVTGAAGFIGSNLLEALLLGNQTVRGFDNFATGHRINLDRVRAIVGEARWTNLSFVEGDIRDASRVKEAMRGVDAVLHQAALGSVPRSIADPATTNDVNISGFLNVLTAAREAEVPSFVYAGSSSTYGDHPALPKVEDRIGRPLSPYAVTKLVNETYAEVFRSVYGYAATGLRYFNVFGPRQDPNGAYAAVIPKWAAAMVRNEPIFINGDGETSRDFCFVANTVQANILAALAPEAAKSEVFNVAVGGRTTLNTLFHEMRAAIEALGIRYSQDPVYREERKGDVRHSQADVSKAETLLGYKPTDDFTSGLHKAMPYYVGLSNQL